MRSDKCALLGENLGRSHSVKTDGMLGRGRKLWYNPDMKKSLLDILACPMCKGGLELTVEEEDGIEVVKGTLHCKTCDENYLIDASIPNLLPPEQR